MLQSPIFRDAPVSRRLLEYLVSNSLLEQKERLKEYTIGVEVLGRKSDFDPKMDTIVRVQVHRLRQKIKNYYETDGRRDAVIITIPKGRYSADFLALEGKFEDQDRTADLESLFEDDGAPESEESLPAQAEEASSLAPPRGSVTLPTWKFSALLVALTLVGVCCGYGIFHIFRHEENSSTAAKLWFSMLGGDSSPIIGYSDAIFLTDSSSNLFQFSGGAVSARGELVEPHIVMKYTLNPDLVAHAGPLYYEDSYTGTGELKGAVLLSALLRETGAQPQVERNQDITTDDLHSHNVILLGGPAQNTAVEQFLAPGDWEYQYRKEAWGATIVNRNPRPGEAPVYQIERDSVSQVVRSTYGLISCQPTVGPHRMIVLGGLDTVGTLGAAEYATSKAGSEALSKASKESPYFQAVVHVTVKNGYASFGTELIAIHTGQRSPS